MTTTETMSQNFQFFLVVDNPNTVDCSAAKLDAFTLADMENFVFTMALDQTIPEVTDSSNGDCGTVSYEIVDELSHQSYLTLDQDSRILTLFSNSEADEGQYSVTVRAFLVDHPAQE